jgi:death-on-curing protein
VIYLSLDAFMALAGATLGEHVKVRDFGLVQAALERPKTTVYGADAYPDEFTKAAALLHSLVSSHPLVDGNKRVGITAAGIFLELNGIILNLVEDEAFDFVMSVADGSIHDIDTIANGLRRFSEPASV